LTKRDLRANYTTHSWVYIDSEVDILKSKSVEILSFGMAKVN